jgi:hypothetical protein
VLVSPSRTEHGRYVGLGHCCRSQSYQSHRVACCELDRIARPVADSNRDRCGDSEARHLLFEGSRNCGLASLAGALRRRGLTQSEIEAALLAANRERCVPPLPEAEVLRIARSIARYPPGPAPQVDTRKAFDLLRASWQRAIRYRVRRRNWSHRHE